MSRHIKVSHQAQSGVTMVVVLIMVLLVTALGIAAVRTLTVQERMASNSFDRNLAMQSAERVLRYAEGIALVQGNQLPQNPNFPVFNSAVSKPGINGDFDYTGKDCGTTITSDQSPCTNGLCSTPTPSCPARWLDPNFKDWQPFPVISGDPTFKNFTPQQYIVEYMGGKFPCKNSSRSTYTCSQYRITVSSIPNSGRASVTLQSTYVVQPGG